jgi:hypothetical protein
MGTGNERLKKGRIARMLGYGILTVGLYAALFTSQGTVMLYFTKGSLFASLPIFTAFLVSFAHGGFTNYFWQVMGIEASKRKIQRRQDQKQIVEREQIRPQPRLRA